MHDYSIKLKRLRRELRKYQQHGVDPKLIASLQNEILNLEEKQQLADKKRQALIEKAMSIPNIHQIPTFTYHPDALATEAIQAMDPHHCLVCKKLKIYFYMGALYTEEDEVGTGDICADCIADGKAHRHYTAEFNTIAQSDVTADIPKTVIEEILYRTPGFISWQEINWQFHCHDATLFLGSLGKAEIEERYPEAKPFVLAHLCDIMSIDNAQSVYDVLSSEGDPSIFLFKCRHCDTYCCEFDAS